MDYESRSTAWPAAVDMVTEDIATSLHVDPWTLRDEYVDVVIGVEVAR